MWRHNCLLTINVVTCRLTCTRYCFIERFLVVIHNTSTIILWSRFSWFRLLLFGMIVCRFKWYYCVERLIVNIRDRPLHSTYDATILGHIFLFTWYWGHICYYFLFCIIFYFSASCLYQDTIFMVCMLAACMLIHLKRINSYQLFLLNHYITNQDSSRSCYQGVLISSCPSSYMRWTRLLLFCSNSCVSGFWFFSTSYLLKEAHC